MLELVLICPLWKNFILSIFRKMASSVRGRIVQITNISPSCSLEQIRMLFGNIGVIEELVLYPPEGNDCPSKVPCLLIS